MVWFDYQRRVKGDGWQEKNCVDALRKGNVCNLLLLMVLAEQVIWFFLCVQIVHPAMASMGHPKKGVSAVQPVNSLPRTAFMEGAAEHQSGEDPTSPVVTCIGQVNNFSSHPISSPPTPVVRRNLATLNRSIHRAICKLSSGPVSLSPPQSVFTFFGSIFKGQGAMMITTNHNHSHYNYNTRCCWDGFGSSFWELTMWHWEMI